MSGHSEDPVLEESKRFFTFFNLSMLLVAITGIEIVIIYVRAFDGPVHGLIVVPQRLVHQALLLLLALNAHPEFRKENREQPPNPVDRNAL